MRLVLLIGMLALFAGCQTDPVFLRHPQTGRTVQCGPYSHSTDPISFETATTKEGNCVEKYERQGYERVVK
jgi:hypothetical protein